MDGLGLDNILGAEQVEKMFSSEADSADDNLQDTEENSDNQSEETVEVDFSDLLGNQPESVGSGNNKSEEQGDAPSSSGGTPTNIFSSIAKALKDEGVFPDTSDDDFKDIKDAASFKQFWENQVAASLDERQRRIEQALNSGADKQEIDAYQEAINLNSFLQKRETADMLEREGEEAENLRKKMMYQDFMNRGFKHERAVRLIEKSLADGTDIEDAKEAYDSCKEFYKQRVAAFQQEIEDRKKEQEAIQEKNYNNLKKHILDTDSFYDGVKVDKMVRQKAYDAITKPTYKDESGNLLTALQRYQREKPMEFMENVAMLWALTDEFKNVDKLTKRKVQAGIKKGFDEVASVLNSTRRNNDGSLNLANTAFDDNRENWSLA